VLPPEQARANASYVAGLTAAAAREPAAQPGGAPQRAADARATGEDAPVYRLGGPAQ
jgi:ABC-type thiamine transport system ATPase subunit